MPFTVIHTGDAKTADFTAYLRLLRWRGVDLGRAPRVPEPELNRRWLYAWTTRAEAEAFAKDLRKDTSDKAWQRAEVRTAPSEGPLGPLVIQWGRYGTAYTLGVHNLSQVLLRSAFPDAVAAASYVWLEFTEWEEYRKRKGDLARLVGELTPNLTGLTAEQVTLLGFSVFDDDERVTLVTVPPQFSVKKEGVA